MALDELRTRGLLETLDVELSKSLCRMGETEDPLVALGAALVSRNVRRGHTCFTLGTSESELWPRSIELPEALPDAATWRERLRQSRLTEDGPLVLDGRGRLYLRRYWGFEQDIARSLREREGRAPEDIDAGWLEPVVGRLFPGGDSPQRRAATNALAHRVSLLCGGPGTGKTTTVAAIVAMLVERHQHETGEPPRVMLLAPTGKAAARLGEAVAGAKRRVDTSEDVLACVPTEASTVHRALGMSPRGMRFRRNAERPLEAEIIVLDEASMIDLALMRQLLDATAMDATLLIVGDPDQLTSVEAGSVLRDLVDASEATWWRDRVTHLTRTWRYDETQPLGQLVRAIRDADTETATALTRASRSDDLVWRPLDALSDELDVASTHWERATHSADPRDHFALRARYVILTPFRHGPIGTRALGTRMEERLRVSGREPPVTPIIIEQNSHELEVFNGDFAMLLDESGVLEAFVKGADAAEPRRLAEARLPRYSKAFALSVHKSQGSEFDEVLVVFPEEDAPLLTRELLYTAVSRAKKRVRIVGPEEVLLAAMQRRARRDSGLVDAIGDQAP